MEVIATAEEEAALAKKWGEIPMYSRIETREHPVRMFDRLPERWIREPETPTLSAQPGEYLAFQLALWVPKAKPVQTMLGVFLKSFGPEPKAYRETLALCAAREDVAIRRP